jgi:prolyl-tRNA editing enzyme YbaK/EbsC (Cys-tRNA(Pro) deacylase)
MSALPGFLKLDKIPGKIELPGVLYYNGMMMDDLSTSARRVQSALGTLGLRLQVVELPESTRTAQEAAQAIGCEVGQIAKSLIFKTRETDRPVLVIASGFNRVDEKIIGRLIGEEISKADADFVRTATGFAIGGVPPVGHSTDLQTFIDEDLLEFDKIWAAAGTPHAVFCLTGEDLVRATRGTVVMVVSSVS